MAHVLWSTFSGEYKCDNVILIRYHVEQIGGHQGQHKHQHHGPQDGKVPNFFTFVHGTCFMVNIFRGIQM